MRKKVSKRKCRVIKVKRKICISGKCRTIYPSRKICRNPEELERSGAYIAGHLDERVKNLKKVSDEIVKFRELLTEKEAEKISKLLDIQWFEMMSYLSELKLKLEDRAKLGF